MKKITSIILALTSVIAIATPAFAGYENIGTPSEAETETAEIVSFVQNDEQGIIDNDAVNEENSCSNDDESILSDKIVAIMYMCASGPHAPYIFGHIWICIKNISDKALKVGSTEIEPGAMASFGLHHFDGLHYDDEMYDYSGEKVKASECSLTLKDLRAAEEEITNSRWHWYEYLTHNCTNFATSVWKKVTGKGFFVFCFPFVVQMQMAKVGLKEILIERRIKTAENASEVQTEEFAEAA